MLRVNNFSWGNVAAPQFAQSVSFSTFITSTVPTANTSHSFLATTVGTASADRLVVVAAYTRGASSFVSASINSSAATIIAQTSQSNANLCLFQMPLPTSETAVDIKFVSASTAATKDAVAVWILKGLGSQTASTFGVTTQQTSSIENIPLNRPDGGVGVGAWFGLNQAPTTWFSPFTKNYETTDFLLDAAAGGSFPAGSASTIGDILVNASSTLMMNIVSIWA